MNRPRAAAFLAAVVLYFVALYTYVPTLPAYVAERASSLAAVGSVLAMYGLWMTILRLPLGIVTDVTGRSKASLVVGVLLAGVGALVMAAGKSTGVLGLGRALTGAAAAAYVPMVAVFAGFFPGERTIFATSLITFATSFGQVVATGLTGPLERLGGMAAPFYAAAGFAAAATAIIVLVKIPRRDPAHDGQLTPRTLLAVFRRRDVLVPSFTSALCQVTVWALVFSFMPLRARQMGAGAVTTSLLMVLNIAATTAANLCATLIPDRGDRRLLLYGTFALFAGGALMAALAGSTALLFASNALMGVAGGLSFPILVGLSIRHVDAAHRTTAMGIHQSVYSVGLFAGPWLGGVVADAVGIPVMFAIAAAFSLVAPSALISLYRDRRTMPAPA